MAAGETLETGYGPSAPPGDNLANDFQQETARSFATLGHARGDRAHGFQLMGHPPLMVRPPNLPLPPAPPELRIVEVTDDATATDLERTLIDGYPVPMMQPFETVQLFTPGALTAAGWKHFVGYVDDRAVAAGSSYVDNRLLRVDNIATLDDARGRGYGNAITAATIGVDLTKAATLIASDLGRPIYEKLGFVAITRATYWLGMR